MTKYQLLKALEPFKDNIEIVCASPNGFNRPQIFYKLEKTDDVAFIVISYGSIGKARGIVELKI